MPPSQTSGNSHVNTHDDHKQLSLAAGLLCYLPALVGCKYLRRLSDCDAFGHHTLQSMQTTQTTRLSRKVAWACQHLVLGNLPSHSSPRRRVCHHSFLSAAHPGSGTSGTERCDGTHPTRSSQKAHKEQTCRKSACCTAPFVWSPSPGCSTRLHHRLCHHTLLLGSYAAF